LATAKVPAKVIAPPVALEGVRPVVPALNVVTPLAGAATQDAVVPLDVSKYPFAPIANRLAVLTPVPIIRSPVVVMGDKALNAAPAVVCPVPPFAIATVPEVIWLPLIAIEVLAAEVN
jgi:hypothetical protein